MTATPLHRERPFLVLLGGYFVSMVGDAFANFAIPLLVLAATGSVGQMAKVSACRALGGFAGTLIVGSFVDRFDRRRFLIGVEAVRALNMGLLAAVAHLVGAWLPALYAAQLIDGFLGVANLAAFLALVPQLVSVSRATAAYSFRETLRGVSFLVGPALAGLIAQSAGLPTMLALDALSFVASFVSLFFVRVGMSPRAGDAKAEAAPASTVPGVGGWVQGFSWILGHPVLRMLTVVLVVQTILTATVLDAFMFQLKRHFGVAETTIGLVMAIACAGSIVLPPLIPPLRKRAGTHGVLGVVLGTIGVALVGASRAGGVWSFSAWAALFFGAWASLAVIAVTLRMECAPDHLRGRVNTSYWSAETLAGALGRFILGPAADRFGVPATFVFAGACLVALVAPSLFAKAFRQWQPPAPQARAHGGESES